MVKTRRYLKKRRNTKRKQKGGKCGCSSKQNGNRPKGFFNF